MANGIQKTQTVIGLMEESTEGTYVAPSAATAYIQPLEDGFGIQPARELLDREVLSPNIGSATPRLGIKSVTASLPVEFRASGTEGAEPDFDLLLQGLLGSRRQVASRFTTSTTHTTTQINGTNIGTTFSVGDMIVVLEAGAYSYHFVSATPTANAITITPPAPDAPPNAVVIAKVTTYFPANSGHKALSISNYWANTVREAGIGCKVTSMTLDNFSTGQLASLNFALEGLNYTQIDGAAPHTPTFDASLPPVILSATVYKGGTAAQINTLSLSVDNTLGFLTATESANGRIKSRVTNREVTGSINPYKDDTTVTIFDDFVAGTTFSLTAFAYVPSSTAGEATLGSIVGIYLPSCIATELVVADEDGLLTDAITFKAVTGTVGDTNEIYIGMC